MTEKEVIKLVQEYIETQFPKTCNTCNKTYSSLKEYLNLTKHVGKPVSYDAEMKNWKLEKQFGTASLANCVCGSTLAISSRHMGLTKMWNLLKWARKEKKKRGVSINDILDDIRKKIDYNVLNETK